MFFRKLVFTLGILAVGVSQAQEITVVQTPAMSGNFAHPAMKDCPMRPYPADSVQKGEVGDVVLDMLVDATSGRPRDSKVVISSGYRSLDMAAVFSLARCTFVLESNRPNDKAWTRIRFQWRLDEPAGKVIDRP